MSSVWGKVLQWGSTIKVGIELPVATRHSRDMTEKLLKVTLNQNKHTNNFRCVWFIFVSPASAWRSIGGLSTCFVHLSVHVSIIIPTSQVCNWQTVRATVDWQGPTPSYSSTVNVHQTSKTLTSCQKALEEILRLLSVWPGTLCIWSLSGCNKKVVGETKWEIEAWMMDHQGDTWNRWDIPVASHFNLP